MSILFRAHKEYLTFHDPMQGGALVDRPTEIRFDPLTGETSRVLFDPGAPFVPPDYTEAAEITGGKKCPFCPDNLFVMTPRFPESQFVGGRYRVGEAVVFPNLFPYSKHSAVVRMSDQHYVRLEQFTAAMITDAFTAACAYLDGVLRTDERTTHVSINWNYLPPSGGSILHPHIQVMASEQPTRYQRLAEEHENRFYQEHGQSYYEALIEEERRLGERWVGQKEMLAWVHAFAPKGHNDFIGVFEDARSYADLGDGHWKALSESILLLFRHFQQVGLASFNLAVWIPVRGSEAGRVHVRLVPRTTVGQLGTSDFSVFNFLQGDYLSYKAPEQVASAASAFFKS